MLVGRGGCRGVQVGRGDAGVCKWVGWDALVWIQGCASG